MEKDIYRSQFRLPQDLYEKLKKSADGKHLSLNAELVLRLQASFEEKSRVPTTANLLIDDAIDAAAFEFSRFAKQLLDNLLSQQLAEPTIENEPTEKK
jgi:hypothetical protein